MQFQPDKHSSEVEALSNETSLDAADKEEDLEINEVSVHFIIVYCSFLCLP